MGQHGPIRTEGGCRSRASVPHAALTELHLTLVRAGLLAEARVAEALRPLGLSAQAFNVLLIVGQAGEPLSPCVISDRMAVPRNTLTHILDLLERQRLVQRERHPHHRGMVLVNLTDDGFATLDAVLPTLRALDADLWSHFSDGERETFVALLARAEAALEYAFSARGTADCQRSETRIALREATRIDSEPD